MTRILALAVSLLAVVAQATTFALVTTNNRSLSSTRETLRFADDDGVQYAQLFAERFGAGRVVLLTELDEQTRALNPGYAKLPAPTRANLDSALTTLRSSLEAARTAGEQTEVFLVFAGHGDVDQGVGYLELADQRFTARDLESVLGALPADRVHLIIDSCNSYFMLNPRKPGGRRWSTEPLDTRSLSERFPNVGTFVSTNAEAIAYEWSELQSGIFSYEVRSGLRGGADADGDGQVTYRELAGFVERANQRIVNQSYRPRVSFAGPKGDANAALLARAETTEGAMLQLDDSRARRLTLRDAQGVRVLDVNQEQGTPLTLRLPAGPLQVTERTEADGVLRSTTLSLAAGFRGALDSAQPASSLTSRGESEVFRELFREPFGRVALAGFEAQPREAEQAFGVARPDIDRLYSHLKLLGVSQRAELGMRLAAGAWSPSANPVSAITGAVGSAGLTTAALLAPSSGDRLSQQAATILQMPEERRASLFLATERSFERLAVTARTNRMMFSVMGIVVGVALAVIVPAIFAAQNEPMNTPAWVATGSGVAAATASSLFLGFYRSPEERAWDAYSTTLPGR
ncbi:MAG: hypothetical protein QM817_01420 [Archangium sp.]